MFKPIWTYAIQLWSTASTSNTEILERFQSEVLRIIGDATWYVPNTVIRRDLQTLAVKEEIRHYSSQYSARLSVHPNDLVVNLSAEPVKKKQLRRFHFVTDRRFFIHTLLSRPHYLFKDTHNGPLLSHPHYLFEETHKRPFVYPADFMAILLFLPLSLCSMPQRSAAVSPKPTCSTCVAHLWLMSLASLAPNYSNCGPVVFCFHWWFGRHSTFSNSPHTRLKDSNPTRRI
jgi:hypothetical protein